MRIIVAITGASGIVLGQRLLEELKEHETHLITTKNAAEVAKHEETESIDKVKKFATHVYDENDLTARIASSSFPVDAMVIVPCSMKTLSAVANGFCDNLVTRSAENVLKMGWKLVVVPRDTPLTLASIENMKKLKLAGAVVLPPSVAYYYKPKTIDDVTNFFVGKILDVLGIEHRLYKMWKGK